jgi:hypothetical protein
VAGVPLVAAAVCPHPPVLVPEVAAGAAPELDDLRYACDVAVQHLLTSQPDRVLTIGSGPLPTGAEVGRPDLPLSRAIGVWLLARNGLDEAVGAGHVVGAGTDLGACGRLGASLAAESDRLALLVMGDGTACRSVKAPGYFDPRAEPFDAAVARALAAVDTAALLGLDVALADALLCAGRAPWQVLAGAVVADGRHWRGVLHYDAAPYGVAYFVATWSPTPPIMNRRS